jgi:hypothetical protein
VKIKENKDEKYSECNRGIYRVRKRRIRVRRVLSVSRVNRTVQHIHVLRVKLVPRCGTCTVNKHSGKCTEVYSTDPQSGSGTSAERCANYVRIEIVKTCIKGRYCRMCRVSMVIRYLKAVVIRTTRADGMRNICKGKRKRYKRKYDKHKYYVAAWTGSIKADIDDKAEGKIYAVMYKYSNRSYVWYSVTVAESIKASIDEKGCGNVIMEQATLGKNSVVNKRYERKYGIYKYYTARGTVSTKEYIDGKPGCKIYIKVYNNRNMPCKWFKTLAESIEASIEERGGGSKYDVPAALGKNRVVDKRYRRMRGKTAGSNKLKIEVSEGKKRNKKYVKNSSETVFSVSEKMDQEGAVTNPEMVGNVPQQATSTGEYYLVELSCYSYNLATCIDMIMSVSLRAYKPYTSSIIIIVICLSVPRRLYFPALQ